MCLKISSIDDMHFWKAHLQVHSSSYITADYVWMKATMSLSSSQIPMLLDCHAIFKENSVSKEHPDMQMIM